VELSPMDIRSIGGFVIEQLGHIPIEGEQLSIPGFEFITLKVIENVIESIRIRRIVIPQEDKSE
jgi:CBS domain containing-hemolysin-like protein